MKKILYSGLFLFLLPLMPAFGQSFAYKTLLKAFYDQDFPLVYPDQREIMGKAVLLDTREKEEYNISHLRNSKWVGHHAFTIDKVKDIPKDTPIVVYCSIGARSQEVGKKLKQAGYMEVYNLYGGIFHWVNEEYPIYKQDKETQKIHPYSKTWGIWLNKGEKEY